MKKQVLIAVAEGSEEMETIIPADILRRATAEVTIASVDKFEVKASRGTKLIADALLADCINNKYDLIIVPGGMPGSETLRDSRILTEMLTVQARDKKLIAAICAAPFVVLQHHGLLDGKKATCHPHFFAEMKNLVQDYVVVDDNFITSQGPGTAVLFALKLVEILFGADVMAKVAKGLIVPK